MFNLRNELITMNKIYLIFFILIPTLLVSQPNQIAKIVTDQVGIDARGFRVWIADVNNDDYPDLLWGGDSGATHNTIYLMINEQDPNSNDPRDRIFIDKTDESGIQQSRISENTYRVSDVAALADLDNDGDVDLVTSIYTHRHQDYMNDRDNGDRTEVLLNDGNGNFSLIEDNSLNTIPFDLGLEDGESNTTAICFLDYDLDGNIDIYFGTWFTRYLGRSDDIFMPNPLVKGNGDGTFEFVDHVGVREPLYGANISDWNNDRYPDIFTSSYCRTSSRLYKNINGNFVDATLESGYNTQILQGDNGQNLCQWEAQPADYDNDGDIDLIEVKVHGGNLSNEGRTTITENLGAEQGFRLEWKLDKIIRDAASSAHVSDMGASWFDWDNDGKLDLAIGQDGYLNANRREDVRLYLLLQTDEGLFVDITDEFGLLPEMEQSHSIEPADYDLDGDIDLFLSSTHVETYIEDGEEKTRSYKRIELIENNSQNNQNNWVQFKLDPPEGANQSCIGARIIIHNSEEKLVREIQAGGGHFGYQSPFIQHIGLGSVMKVDSIEIWWPHKDMLTTKIYEFPANSILEVDVNGIKNIIQKEVDEFGLISAVNHIDFDTVNVGESKIYKFELNNKGNKEILIKEIKLNQNPEFMLNNEYLDLTLLPNENIEVEITYTPSSRKRGRTFLNIESNAINDNDSYSIEVTGFGYESAPIIAVDNNEIEFNTVWIDSLDTQTLTIHNVGELPLEINKVEFMSSTNDHDAFSSKDFYSPVIIDAGDTYYLEINFLPLEIKDYTASALIHSNSYDNSVLAIKLNGSCDGPLPVLSLASFNILSFGNTTVGEEETRSFSVSNTGNYQLEIYDMPITDNEDNAFLVDYDLPAIIQPNDVLEIEVKFRPNDEVENYNRDLSFDANAVSNESINLRGRAVISSVIELADNSGNIECQVYPHPVNSVSTLSISVNSNQTYTSTIFIADLAGRIVGKQRQITLHPGKNQIQLDLSAMSKGTYSLVIQDRSFTLRQAIVKM